MSRRSLALLFCLSVTALQTQAAGGHHAVDDAAILDPGQCQIETWFDRESGGSRALVHTGPACRVGPVELGLNVDRSRTDADGSLVSGGPQVKWAYALSDSWSAGAVLSATWKSRAPRYVGSMLVVPVTWTATESVAVHANFGREFRHGAADVNRSGVALEWTPVPTWSLLAERFRESHLNHWRVGTRWTPHPAIGIDLSQARGIHRSVPPWWTLGVTWMFDR